MNRFKIQDSRLRNGILILIILTTHFLLPASTLAQTQPRETEYKLLAPLPGVETAQGSGKSTASGYIGGFFRLLIAVAGVLAVVMLIYGGIQYMSTDAFQGKSDAKKTIQNAIWGLLLAIGSWLILYTVNPQLIEFNLSLTPIEIRQPITPPPGGTPVPGSCQDCVVPSVPHKRAPAGCAAPGPCTINRALNTKLVALRNAGNSLTVSESFPPTIAHSDPCHNSGTCVDATIPSNSAQNVKKFLEDAGRLGLNATFEVTSQNRFVELTRAGVPSAKVIVNSRARGEHFHVKL